MINLFRKNQRVLMLIIAVLTIIAFVLLYNTAQLDELGKTRNPIIYGRALTPGALDRQVKNYQLAAPLGQFDLLTKLGGAGADRGVAASEFVWNLLVLQHQARLLGIQPTDEQVEDRIKTLPVFQTASQFDPIKYTAFVREQLAPRGFTERQLEEVMRDALRLERITPIVEAPAAVGDAEIQAAARSLQAVTAQVVRFEAVAQAANVQVPAEEIAEYYERNKAELNTVETRAVRYVSQELPADNKLEGRKKIEEMQKLANSASLFVESLSHPGGSFQQAAEAAGLPIHSTPAFDRRGSLTTPAPVGEDAQQISSIVNALAPAVFLLRETGKTSDVIQAGDAFYVVELSELKPARPLTLEEATPQIEARLKKVKTEKALRESAEKQIAALNTALAGGTLFEDAAAQAGLKVESFENLSAESKTLTSDQRQVLAAALPLREGELSKFQIAPWGGLTVYLKTRAPLDEKDMASRREEIRQALLQNKRRLLFAEWLRSSREEAKISMPGGQGN